MPVTCVFGFAWQVVVPPTFEEYTTRRVLTTGWLDGEKLSQSREGDVAQLVNLGVVAYLKQLLDTGFFHVSPMCLPTLDMAIWLFSRKPGVCHCCWS